jgi:beta-barrel assembly-enhancing protease
MPSDDHAPIFDGRFSDGRTAASYPVRVQLAAQGLKIERGEGAGPLLWPYAGLETSEPLTSAAVDVLVHEPGRAGATVFVNEGAFVRKLAAIAPHLTAGSQRWRVAKPWVALTAAVAAVFAIVSVTDFSPARGIAGLLPHDTRVAIGKQVIRSMGYPVCDGEAGKAALAVLAKRLSDASGSGKSFDVAVIDSPVVNAFAAPGEEIVIMRRLLEKAESADEVAGVLAHEMGHGIELHPETGIVRAVGLMAITEFMLGGSGGTLANMGLYLTQASYSRQAEREADGHAMRILKNAGIGTRGITDFFRRMGKIEGDSADPKTKSSSGGALDILRSHPSTAERLQRFEQQPGYTLSAEEWKSLKRICGTSSEPVPPKPGKPAAKVPAPVPAPPPAPRAPSKPTPAERDI